MTDLPENGVRILFKVVFLTEVDFSSTKMKLVSDLKSKYLCGRSIELRLLTTEFSNLHGEL